MQIPGEDGEFLISDGCLSAGPREMAARSSLHRTRGASEPGDYQMDQFLKPPMIRRRIARAEFDPAHGIDHESLPPARARARRKRNISPRETAAPINSRTTRW